MIYPEIAILFFVFGVVSGQSPTPCVWSFKSDTNTRGGMSTSHLSLAECQTKCLEFSSCIYGLDWDPNNVNGMRCWFSTGTDSGSAPGVIHYYQSCVETTLPPSLSTTTTSTCNWVPHNNTFTIDGNLKQDANTIDACKEKCLNQLDCKSGFGFDFNANNPEGQRCYLSTSKTLLSLAGIIHYTCSNFYTSSSPVQIYKPGSLFLMVLIIVERLFELQW